MTGVQTCALPILVIGFPVTIFEQAEQETEQMPVGMMTKNDINEDDISSLELPNLQQNNEVM